MKVRSLREAVAFQLSEQETLAKVVGVPLSQHKLRRAAHCLQGLAPGVQRTRVGRGGSGSWRCGGRQWQTLFPPPRCIFPTTARGNWGVWGRKGGAGAGQEPWCLGHREGQLTASPHSTRALCVCVCCSIMSNS